MLLKQNDSQNDDIKKKTPEPLQDLDDFIFKDEEIKYQSER